MVTAKQIPSAQAPQGRRRQHAPPSRTPSALVAVHILVLAVLNTVLGAALVLVARTDTTNRAYGLAVLAGGGMTAIYYLTTLAQQRATGSA